ncbi:hypothetical protein TGPRC2_213580 [Toxoplasma gondii TgCatPRC2]|uniref:Uncharacterized protein n=12 Tax=Toxoplasma gondii TaxID=5811 RepID=B9PSL5_TOXGV|nr:hypothetical protein TGGT1_213580 [Toxoplasma gondii GT1]ESS30780.1 hypothetical protein TGVEG_213580 [Toxoplasma gondii VEG]KAF4643722.1 hypothetical protein TGRH88_024770 [Toxoplasma gondii]KFG40273.1 hypothetical protein TGDOM2_213580 [Toxoplasma gondii GAB2-2007-GAL-DOM2]KFG44381.1 hypothetical protein TGP89_213580 [Toxoplasma gondii p89]KFG54918.1 hypothetical protein TGFOU_213580 [Toxoplasma gondii FOU]KFG63126.1 hypothetical protein TGRUB_213580 [Toxoplasma gondii RUB]KFH08593.1 hy
MAHGASRYKKARAKMRWKSRRGHGPRQIAVEEEEDEEIAEKEKKDETKVPINDVHAGCTDRSCAHLWYQCCTSCLSEACRFLGIQICFGGCVHTCVAFPVFCSHNFDVKCPPHV